MTDFICNDLIEMIGKQVVKVRDLYELDKIAHRVKWFDVKCAINNVSLCDFLDKNDCVSLMLMSMNTNDKQSWLASEYVCYCCFDKVKASDSKRCGTCEDIYCPDCIGNFSGANDCDDCCQVSHWDHI